MPERIVITSEALEAMSGEEIADTIWNSLTQELCPQRSTESETLEALPSFNATTSRFKKEDGTIIEAVSENGNIEISLE